jgi:hypothetical protein
VVEDLAHDRRVPAIETSRVASSDRVESIRRELNQRHDEDQAFLKANLDAGSDARDYEPLRRENNRYLRALLDEVGWIDAETLGVRTTYYAFMLIQHSSDLGLMLAALPYVERDLRDAGYSESYALLFDRLQVMQGKPQRYGTQMARLPNGEAIVLPVEDLESVDERRRSIGLPPLEEYLGVAAKYLFDGKRPQHWDAGAVSAALSAGGGDSQWAVSVSAA